METIIGIVAVGILLFCFGGDIVDFIFKIFGILFMGGCSGLFCGAIGWLIAAVIFSAGVYGFLAGFVVGVIIYICKWL